ncbi:hypothetical protein MACJ_002555 [Theileria orientalis]|uniref:Uncharacterized protein n=1 Tax=Theileria orientalis TaxID=68886 RepID=A0A976M6G4_THEOR|nr:hypothetical protein MACJ_002555 [Theileria orientalis]
MRFYRKFLFFGFLYSISNDKLSLLKFTDTLPIPNPSFGSGADITIGGSYADLAAKKTKGDYSATPELKLFKDDGYGNPVEMQATDFDKRDVAGYGTYKVKDSVKCVLVKFGEDEVWNNGEYYFDEPEYVAYNDTFDSVTLSNDKKSVFCRKDTKSGKWKYVSVLDKTNQTNSAKASGTPESNDLVTPELTEDDKSELTDVSTTNPNEDDVFSVEFEGDSSADQSRRGSDDSDTGEESGYGSRATTPPPDRADGESGYSISVKSDQDSTSIESLADTSVSKTGVDLNIKSDKMSNKKLEYEKVGEYVTYTAKDNYAFKLVKDCDTEVWKANDFTEYSLRVEVDRLDNDSRAVTVYLDGNKTRVFVKDVSNKLWKEIDITLIHPNPVDIDFPYECYFHKNELHGNIRTFTAKKGFSFNSANEYVDDNILEIWKADNKSQYAIKIEVDLINNDSKAVTVFQGDRTRVFIKENANDPWKEIDITLIHPNPVDIDFPYECYFHKNELDNNVRTFIAKNGFSFKGGHEYVDGNEVEIWKAVKEIEYSNKIEVDLMNNYSKAVTLYIDDVITKVFKKDGKNEPWNEIDITRVNPKPVNIGFIYETYFCKNEFDNNTRTFEARDGFAFNVVNEGIGSNKVQIWKTINENEYAKKVVAGGNKVTIYIGNDRSTKVFAKGSYGKWTEITSGRGSGTGQSCSGAPSCQPSGKGPAGSLSQSSSSATQPQDSPASHSQSIESLTSQPSLGYSFSVDVGAADALKNLSPRGSKL